MLVPPSANAEAPLGGLKVVNVVIVEPPSNTVRMTVVTDSWSEAVVMDIPVLKDVSVDIVPPAGTGHGLPSPCSASS